MLRAGAQANACKLVRTFTALAPAWSSAAACPPSAAASSNPAAALSWSAAAASAACARACACATAPAPGCAAGAGASPRSAVRSSMLDGAHGGELVPAPSLAGADMGARARAVWRSAGTWELPRPGLINLMPPIRHGVVRNVACASRMRSRKPRSRRVLTRTHASARGRRRGRPRHQPGATGARTAWAGRLRVRGRCAGWRHARAWLRTARHT